MTGVAPELTLAAEPAEAGPLSPLERLEALCDPGSVQPIRSRVTSRVMGDAARAGDGVVAAGATNREIGKQLHLSPHTVKDHTSELYRKLRVRNRLEAARRAEALGLI